MKNRLMKILGALMVSTLLVAAKCGSDHHADHDDHGDHGAKEAHDDHHGHGGGDDEMGF